MTAVDKLLYRIGLVDQMSGPAKKVTKSITGIQVAARKGLTRIAQGTAGLAAAGYTVHKLTEPAVQMNRALGEVASLDVDPRELALLEKTAKGFAVGYGKSATEFVRSAYDIQSAIQGLRNGELAAFTRSSNLLAAATKADAATATDYMSTMYGIFEKDAKRLGKAQWVQQMTGQTATAVRLFKTTGMEMASAFSTIGSTAEKAGVGASEQLAILGQLQTTMSGSEAATRYQSFILGIGKAQKALGLRFTDARGKMLPTVEILEKIRARFGNLDSVAKTDLLKEAFGRKEAVALVTNLIDKTGALRASMTELEKVKGLGPAEEMARKMTDSNKRLAGAFEVLRLTVGRTVQTAIVPFVDRAAAGMRTVAAWLDANPRLAKGLGIATVGVLVLTAGIGAFTVAMGVVSMVKAAVLTFTALANAARIAAIATKIWTAAQWLMNAALTANPIGLVIVGIAALIGVIALAVKHWDKLKAAGLVCWGVLKTAGTAVLGALGKLFEGYISVWLWGIRKVLGVMAKVPVAGKAARLALDKIDSFSAPRAPAVETGSTAKRVDVPAGGLKQSFNRTSSTSFGDVHISSAESPSPAVLEEWLAISLA